MVIIIFLQNPSAVGDEFPKAISSTRVTTRAEAQWRPGSSKKGDSFRRNVGLVIKGIGLYFSSTHSIDLQVEPGKPGAEVSKKKAISQRKNLPIECAQGDQPL